MTDFVLKPDHDLDLTNQSLSLTSDTNGQSIAQRLKIKLWMFKGEYFFNTEYGVPYYQEIFVKGATKDEVDQIFKTAILETPGVEEIIRYTSEFNRTLRTFTLDFTVRTLYGPVTIEV